MFKCSDAACAADGRCNCKTDIALLVLRLALAVIFIFHGWGKIWGDVPGMEVFTGMLANLGFPAPVFFAWLAALVELLGGIALLLGVFSRYAGALLAIVMAVAFFTVKLPQGGLPAGDPDIALFAAAVAISLAGPGRYALMRNHCLCGPRKSKESGGSDASESSEA